MNKCQCGFEFLEKHKKDDMMKEELHKLVESMEGMYGKELMDKVRNLSENYIDEPEKQTPSITLIADSELSDFYKDGEAFIVEKNIDALDADITKLNDTVTIKHCGIDVTDSFPTVVARIKELAGKNINIDAHLAIRNAEGKITGTEEVMKFINSKSEDDSKVVAYMSDLKMPNTSWLQRKETLSTFSISDPLRHVQSIEVRKLSHMNEAIELVSHLPLSKGAILKRAESLYSDGWIELEKRSEMPDSDFAFVKEVDGKMMKKLPIHDAAHARNALARWNQTQFPEGTDKEAVLKKIISACKKFGIEVSDDMMKKAGMMENSEMENAMTPDMREKIGKCVDDMMAAGKMDMINPRTSEKFTKSDMFAICTASIKGE